MELLVVLSSLLLAVMAAPEDDRHILAEWNNYKAAHHKSYPTPEEDRGRLNNFLANKRTIEEHNGKYERGESSYSMAPNAYSDWFPEELGCLTGLREEREGEGGEGEVLEAEPGTKVPDSWNWVEKGAVTQVKNQGSCGSCYAFSAVGALEGLMFLKNETITDLSVQELVDCAPPPDLACFGGFPTACFEYVSERGGIDSNATYPYEAKRGKCRAKEGRVAASCTGFKSIPRDEEALKVVVATSGPVSVCFAVSNEFVSYYSGIYDGTCAGWLNHAMLLVGYGTDEMTGLDYWLVKNSWGFEWGEEGFVRILRNNNTCGIADRSSIPVYLK